MDSDQRVVVNIPHTLLQDIDNLIQKKGFGNRNEFIREAMKVYLKQEKRKEIRENLRDGYREMSELNLKLADEGIEYDVKLMNYYVESLAECE